MTRLLDSIFEFLFGPIETQQDTPPDVVTFKSTSASDYFKYNNINLDLLQEQYAPAPTPQPVPTYAEPKIATPQREMVSDGFWLRPEHSFRAKPAAKEYEPYDPDYPLGFKDGYDDDWDKAYTDLYPYEEVTFERDEYQLDLPPEMMED